MNYSVETLAYFHETPHAGCLDFGPDVFQAEAGSQSSQDHIKFFVQIKNEEIVKARFQAKGAVAIIASGEFLAQWCEGKSLAELADLKIEFVLRALELADTKIHAPRLAVTALKSIGSTKKEEL